MTAFLWTIRTMRKQVKTGKTTSCVLFFFSFCVRFFSLAVLVNIMYLRERRSILCECNTTH